MIWQKNWRKKMKLLKSERIKNFFKGRIKSNELLSAYTSMKVGGVVELFLQPNNYNDLASVISFLEKERMRYVIIGAGTNLLIEDNYLPMAVIKLDSLLFTKLTHQQNIVFAAGGVLLKDLVEYSQSKGFSGSEFLSGIPGTVGGALVMNAGTRDIQNQSKGEYKSIADILSKVKLMSRDGAIIECSSQELNFGYRGSSFQDYIVLGAWFCLNPQPKELILETIKRFQEHKQKTQAISMPNAGCVFKNPNQSVLSAGKLIESCCLKGLSIGDAQISKQHANFIVNRDKAKFEDIIKLMERIKQDVNSRFDIILEPEIKIWQN